MNRIEGIQWLRAVAALGVVAYHAAPRTGFKFEVGSAGVNIFFVISGFIMWWVTEKGISPFLFARDRVFRIVPAYWIATTLVAVGALLHFFPRIEPITADRFLKSLFFIPEGTVENGVFPVLWQGWTLNYEMFFYLLFFLILFLRRPVHAFVLVSVLCGLVVSSLILEFKSIPGQFYTNAILLEFAAGVIVGFLTTRGFIPSMTIGLVFVALGLVGFVIVGAVGVPPWFKVPYLFPSALLVWGVIAIDWRGISFAWRPATLLGDASYSIYLFHSFAISIALKIAGTGFAGLVVSLVGSIVLGLAALFVIEHPIAAYLRRPKNIPGERL